MNETYRTILGLRAIREFQDRPLEEEDLDAVLEAARWTGSAKNLQNWAVIIVRDRDQIERVAACGNGTGPLLAAPVTLVLVQEPGAYELDTGRMSQNIMLAADSLGMATCPITLHQDGDAARVLGLPPGWRCRYAIALGYPAPHRPPQELRRQKAHRGDHSPRVLRISDQTLKVGISDSSECCEFLPEPTRLLIRWPWPA